jgi:hypothetical protein
MLDDHASPGADNLLEEARRARRLASGITDFKLRAMLIRLAEEYEATAHVAKANQKN